MRLTAVHAVDATTAYAVGESGTILRTTNGGVTWSTRPSGTTVMLHDVTATLGGTVIAVGINSTILRSTDGGTSFAALAPGGLPLSFQELVGVAQGRGSTMFVATAWHGSWRSLDAGLTWSALPGDLLLSGSSEVTGISAMGDTVAIVAESAQIEISRDAGTTWTMSNADSLTWGRMFRPALLESHRLLVPSEFSGYVTLVPSATSTIADYGGGATWGNPVATTNLFGACLQAVGATTAPGAGWTVDGGTCTAGDADPWHAVPTLAEPLATTASAGVPGQVDLVWGVRTAQNQPPGDLRATVAFEAIAPNV